MLLLLLCATSEDNLDGLPSLILSMALVLWKSLLEILLIRDGLSSCLLQWSLTIPNTDLLLPALPCTSWFVIWQLWSWLSSLGQLTNLSECTPPTWLHTPYFHQASMTKEPIGILCYALDILYISIFSLVYWEAQRGIYFILWNISCIFM